MNLSSDNANIRIIKNSLFLYIRMLLIMGISLYTSRIVLKSLGVEDYGLYNVVGGIVSLFAFVNGAMSLSTQRYIAYELGKAKGNITKIFSTCLLIHILIALIIVVLAETVGLYIFNEYMTIPPLRRNAAFIVYQFSILNCVVMILSTPYNGAIVAYEKMQAFAYISLLEAFLRLIIAFIITYTFFDNLIIYSFLLFVAQLFIRCSYSIYCRKKLPEVKFHFTFDKKCFKEILGFSSWTLFNNASIIACTQGINLLLNIVFNPVVNAARGIAVQLEFAVSSFAKNIQMAINPQITKNYAMQDYSKYKSLIMLSSKYTYFLLLLLSIPVMLETDYILNLWLTEIPEHTVDFIHLILIVSLVNILSEPLNTGVNATGRIKRFQAISGILLIGIIPISFFLLKTYRYPTLVFFVYIVMSLIVYFYKLFYAIRNIDLSFKKYAESVILPVVSVTTIAFLSSLCVKRHMAVSSFGDFIVSLSIYVALTIAAILLFGFSQKEKKIITCKIKKTILSLKSKKK